ncbi:MAG: carbonic anhydrase, partial [Hydrogenophaga sp.]|nr:carbonic anhydrase [Hydrogenophaga sp.]
MSASLQDLFDHNREWAAAMVREKPTFFTDLLAQQ